MNTVKSQTLLTKGIYEFEDPSGCLMAARTPAHGSADLYKGTAITVRPNQCAVLIYKGEIADVFPAGLHYIETENVPILTRLANWKFGFKSPLRCDLWFFSGNVFTARRWGTASPIIAPIGGLGTVPLRGYGNYSILIKNPLVFYQKLIGSRTSFDITDAEEFIQGQLMELLPNALQVIPSIQQLNQMQTDVAKRVQVALSERLLPYGLAVKDVQVISLLPTKEIMEALDAKVAMQVIGNQKDYLLYKAANSLGSVAEGGASDPMQMMLGLMVGKGLVGADYRQKEQESAGAHGLPTPHCPGCKLAVTGAGRFCSNCGKELKS